ncbi:Bromodomain-containing protein [Limtongia smithiae]|uniref:Bromodomain-containing protein n=1 Tax=Limtongia smithiae TaxID=1125753 RepID=UPI0034CD957C
MDPVAPTHPAPANDVDIGDSARVPLDLKAPAAGTAPLSPPIPSPPLTHSESIANGSADSASLPEKHFASDEGEPPAKRVKSEHDDDESAVASDIIGSSSSGPIPKHQSKFALSMLRSLKRLKDAYPFLVPVDPVKLNIPDYPTIITTPMDLSTMEKKLTGGEYSSIDSFVDDFGLIVSNCVRYNGPESKIAEMGKNLRASFDRQLKQMPPVEVAKTDVVGGKRKKSMSRPEDSFALTPSGIPIIRRDSTNENSGRPKREIHPPRPKDLPYSEAKPRRKKYAAELKFCGTVLKELQSKKYEAFSYPFLLPVDPVALNCPTYFRIIKKPMDLSTIQQKLNNNQYETGDEFEEDVRLMFRNCYKFNPESSPVNTMGRRLELVFEKKWAERPELPPPVRAESPEESSSEESEDEDMSDQAISNLERQLADMQSQLLMMKKMQKDTSKKKKKDKEHKRKNSLTSLSGKKKKSKTSSAIPKEIPHVSYDMKKELSEKITTLSGAKLTHVVKMIHESMPHLKNSQDEIELDVDQLDPVTLVKLYNYVTKNSPGAAVKSSPAAVTSSAQKAKKKTKEEQKKHVAQLEKQLKAIQSQTADSSDDESSDDDSEESSSEEE